MMQTNHSTPFWVISTICSFCIDITISAINLQSAIHFIFVLLLTRKTVLLTNECGLSTIWKTGVCEPITCHLVSKIRSPVAHRMA